MTQQMQCETTVQTLLQ